MDSVLENLNGRVDSLFDNGVLQRVLAQIDIRYSNSMIETGFRALKHNCLFLHQLNDAVTAKRLVEFYVREHNTAIRSSAFGGERPNEIYFRTGAHVRHEVMAIRLTAKPTSVQRNRSACGACPRPQPRARSDRAT